MKSLKISTKIKTTIPVYYREYIIRSPDWNEYFKTTFMMVYRLSWHGRLVTDTHSEYVLGQAYRGLTRGFLLLWIFSVDISVSSNVCLILDLILMSMFLR